MSLFTIFLSIGMYLFWCIFFTAMINDLNDLKLGFGGSLVFALFFPIFMIKLGYRGVVKLFRIWYSSEHKSPLSSFTNVWRKI